MRIECPHCGERGPEEFTYRGDASVRRPSNDQGWTDYVYLRANPAGAHTEYWYHAAGCQSWLIVTRDTRTHTISHVQAARPA